MATFFILITLLLFQASIQHLVNPRITNGLEAQPGQFPFMASIQLSHFPFLTYVHECGGVVIDEYWILSTAVCIKGIMGTNRSRVVIDMLYTYRIDSNVQIIEIAEKIIHENFNGNVWTNDIGLIKLATPISNATLIRLPLPRNITEGEVFILGWGKTSKGIIERTPEVLQYSPVRIYSNRLCASIISFYGTQTELLDSQMCASSTKLQVIVRHGDAGGPVIKYRNGEPEVVGLLSWTLYSYSSFMGFNKKADPGIISTRVSYFIEWIEEKISETIEISAGIDDDLLTPLIVHI